MKEIKAYSKQGLEEIFEKKGYPKFRAKQVIQWLYQKGVSSYDEMTNLPSQMREDLRGSMPLYCARIFDKQISKDGTRKYIIQFHDGCTAEMVAIPSGNRLTVCFSTQVGCGMACLFCATGQQGYTRNLLPGEIVDQVLIAQKDMEMRVSNLVGMGQGEPFHNYDNVLAALRFMNSNDGLGIGARHITVSTCGITRGIRRFAKEPEQFTLAVSLHSAIQETRNEIMPRMANQNLKELHETLCQYQQNSGRRISLEYVLIREVNDDDRHLYALIDFCKGVQCHVNIIQLNSIDGSSLKPSSKARVRFFIDTLTKRGVEATLRDSRGGDIDGACGQLNNKTQSRERPIRS